MSDMKCPFCKQDLNQDNPQSIECRNDDCKKSYFMYGSKELWQELIKLMEKNKDLSDKIGKLKYKLDIAIDALKIAQDCCSDYSIECLAHKALEQITALEQKDVK